MAGGNPYPNREYPPGLFDDDGPINQTLIAINEWNPLANAVNGIKGFFTGTDLNGREMSGLDPGMTLAGAIPFVKFGKVGVNFVKAGSRVFEVGAYNALKGAEAGLQAHHVGQKALMRKFIPGYNWKTAPSILVPELGHTLGSGVLSRGTSGFINARQVLARDIFELRRVYPNIPNSSLQKLIEMNRSMYPNVFKK